MPWFSQLKPIQKPSRTHSFIVSDLSCHPRPPTPSDFVRFCLTPGAPVPGCRHSCIAPNRLCNSRPSQFCAFPFYIWTCPIFSQSDHSKSEEWDLYLIRHIWRLLIIKTNQQNLLIDFLNSILNSEWFLSKSRGPQRRPVDAKDPLAIN